MAKKRGKKRKAIAKKRARRPAVARLSIGQLEAMIAKRRAAQARALRMKRAKLAKDLAALDKQIAALGGKAPQRAKRRVVRKKRGRVSRKAKVAKKKRIRSTPGQIAAVERSILKAVKSRKNGLLKVELTKAVRSRAQTLNTALKRLIATRKVKIKGVTRNTRYLAA